MKEQRESLDIKRAEYEEKLLGLRAYARELKETADKHGTDSQHYEEDLTKAANDTQFYESELQRIGDELKESADDLTYYVFKDKAGEWRWHLRTANGRIVADSGEGYGERADCLHGIELVKNSADAKVEDKQ